MESSIFYLDEYCDKKVTNFQGFFLVCKDFPKQSIILINSFMERFVGIVRVFFTVMI